MASAAVQQFCPELRTALQAAAAEPTELRTGARAFGRSSSVVGWAVTELDNDGRRTRSQVRVTATFSRRSK